MEQRSKHALLDPHTDPDRWERVVRSIMAAARPELRRRAAARTPVLLLADWLKPGLAAAAAVMVVAAGALLAVRDAVRDVPPSAPAVAEVIAPAAVATWLVSGAYPTAEELVVAMEGAKP